MTVNCIKRAVKPTCSLRAANFTIQMIKMFPIVADKKQINCQVVKGIYYLSARSHII